MKLAIITSGGANFYSIEVVLQRLGIEYELTVDKNIINSVDGVILPGVGSAGHAMEQLHKNDLITTIQNYKKPLLGICLGMQLLYDFSTEGNVPCLGILSGNIQRFDDAEITVPQMGWNNIYLCKKSPLLKNVDLARDVYFVHSYYAPISKATIASCDYGVQFSAIAHKDNFYGMQFHPEKSGAIGEKLIANFIDIVKNHKL